MKQYLPTIGGFVITLEALTLSGVVVASFFRALPEGAVQPVMLIVGAFIAHIGTFVSWKWGSSQGSREKDLTIAEVTRGRRVRVGDNGEPLSPLSPPPPSPLP